MEKETWILWLNRFVGLASAVLLVLSGTSVIEGKARNAILILSAIFGVATLKVAEWLPNTKKDAKDATPKDGV